MADVDLNGRHTLTPAQVEREYNIKEKTLANWRSQKKGPKYSKAGRTILYRRANIERFLDKCQKVTTENL